MENNNGRGIFYGVIGVATLIVAIIGATFAYFTATANSTNNAVETSGAKLGLTWLENKDGIKTNLIPVDTNLLFSKGTIAATAPGCKDKDGYNVCSVYQFGVENPGNVAQTINVTLDSVVNTFVNYKETGTTNLRYAIFNGWEQPTTLEGALVGKTSIKVGTENTNNFDGIKSELTKTLAAKGSADGSDTAKYTIVLWIEETKDAQDADQEKSFAAGVTISSSNGGTGVSGTFAG